MKNLLWSFMHDDENLLCPFVERRLAMIGLKQLCQVRVGPVHEILEVARSYVTEAHLSQKDALHVACAVHCGARYFLIVDGKWNLFGNSHLRQPDECHQKTVTN